MDYLAARLYVNGFVKLEDNSSIEIDELKITNNTGEDIEIEISDLKVIKKTEKGMKARIKELKINKS